MASSLPRVVNHSFIKSIKRSTKLLTDLKKVDPSERFVVLYPDSESAHVGMGFSLLNCPPAEDVYESASKQLNKDILKLCLEGPESDLLDCRENRDVATFVTSHATMAKLRDTKPEVIQFSKATGGIGIGLFNSLVFSGAMSFEDGLDLVYRQAQAMDKAAKVVPSARVRIRLKPATRTNLICRAATEHCIEKGIPEEIAVCSISRKISPNLVEVSGHEEAIKYLEEGNESLFEFYYIRRLRKFPTAYHSRLMQPVSDFIKYYIEQKQRENSGYLVDPSTSSVYSGTSGERLRFAESIKRELHNFAVKPILLEALIHTLYTRPKKLAQPRTLIVWDRKLRTTICKINRRAADVATVLEA